MSDGVTMFLKADCEATPGCWVALRKSSRGSWGHSVFPEVTFQVCDSLQCIIYVFVLVYSWEYYPEIVSLFQHKKDIPPYATSSNICNLLTCEPTSVWRLVRVLRRIRSFLYTASYLSVEYTVFSARIRGSSRTTVRTSCHDMSY